VGYAHGCTDCAAWGSLSWFLPPSNLLRVNSRTEPSSAASSPPKKLVDLQHQQGLDNRSSSVTTGVCISPAVSATGFFALHPHVSTASPYSLDSSAHASRIHRSCWRPTDRIFDRALAARDPRAARHLPLDSTLVLDRGAEFVLLAVSLYLLAVWLRLPAAGGAAALLDGGVRQRLRPTCFPSDADAVGFLFCYSVLARWCERLAQVIDAPYVQLRFLRGLSAVARLYLRLS